MKKDSNKIHKEKPKSLQEYQRFEMEEALYKRIVKKLRQDKPKMSKKDAEFNSIIFLAIIIRLYLFHTLSRAIKLDKEEFEDKITAEICSVMTGGKQELFVKYLRDLRAKKVFSEDVHIKYVRDRLNEELEIYIQYAKLRYYNIPHKEIIKDLLGDK